MKISDGNNENYLCAVEEMTKESVRVKILETFCTDTESSCRIVLFQGLPKSDKMDWIVQKSVELGVSEIVPMATARAVVKLDEKKAKKKTERWQAVSESAAKQAGRGRFGSKAGHGLFRGSHLRRHTGSRPDSLRAC